MRLSEANIPFFKVFDAPGVSVKFQRQRSLHTSSLAKALLGLMRILHFVMNMD